MRLRVLGCAGAEFPDFRPPAFLVDDGLLLDAGTIGAVLTEEQQWQLRAIFITHAHLDHIRGIPALADNILIRNLRHLVTVYATETVVTAMRTHLLNGTIWPDFTLLPSTENPVLRYDIITPGRPLTLGGPTLPGGQAMGTRSLLSTLTTPYRRSAIVLKKRGAAGLYRRHRPYRRHLAVCQRSRCCYRRGFISQQHGLIGHNNQASLLFPAGARVGQDEGAASKDFDNPPQTSVLRTDQA